MPAFQLIYEDAQVDASASSFVADRTVFWWNERKPDEQVLFNSKIRLGEAFYNEIIRNPVPLDMNTLTALKRCSLGLDIYLWLVYRIFALRAPQYLTWRQVYRQFAAHPENAHNKKTIQNFRVQALRELKKIKLGLAGVELHYGSGRLDPLTFNPDHRTSQSRLARKLIPLFRAKEHPLKRPANRGRLPSCPFTTEDRSW